MNRRAIHIIHFFQDIRSGLANYADLIQAEYLLIKAETENKTNFMGVWKALLYKAAVKGDLNIFLNQVN